MVKRVTVAENGVRIFYCNRRLNEITVFLMDWLQISRFDMIESLSGVNNTLRLALYVIHNPCINRISIIVLL